MIQYSEEGIYSHYFCYSIGVYFWELDCCRHQPKKPAPEDSTHLHSKLRELKAIQPLHCRQPQDPQHHSHLVLLHH